jgi:hypothetical protein
MKMHSIGETSEHHFLRVNGLRFQMSKKNASRSSAASVYRRRESGSASTEWSTGRRLGEDVPVERADEDSASMIPTGACGAFVTALEDEFMGGWVCRFVSACICQNICIRDDYSIHCHSFSSSKGGRSLARATRR